MIEPAAEAEAVKKVKEDLENGQWQNVFNVIPLPKAKP
jgi:hypothetical protein